MSNKYDLITQGVPKFLQIMKEGRAIGIDRGLSCNLDYKEWQKSDITDLATHEASVTTFYLLLLAAGHAYRNNGDIESALDAQRVLENFKPDSCENVLAFRNMIVQVFNETKEQRAQLKTEKPQFLNEITGDLLEIPEKKKLRIDTSEGKLSAAPPGLSIAGSKDKKSDT
jgi:hypothetical protein